MQLTPHIASVFNYGRSLLVLGILWPLVSSAQSNAPSAHFYYMERGRAGKHEVTLDSVQLLFIVPGIWAPGNDPGHSFADTFDVVMSPMSQTTGTVCRVTIPLSGIASIDFVWPPDSQSQVAYGSSMTIRMRDGVVHRWQRNDQSLYLYSYTRSTKAGETTEEFTGYPATGTADTVGARLGAVSFPVRLHWAGFAGIGRDKSEYTGLLRSDGKWAVDNRFVNVDRIDFTPVGTEDESTPANNGTEPIR